MNNEFDTITADQLTPVTGGGAMGIVAPQPGTLDDLFGECVAGKQNMYTGKPLYGAALRSHCKKYVRNIRF